MGPRDGSWATGAADNGSETATQERTTRTAKEQEAEEGFSHRRR